MKTTALAVKAMSFTIEPQQNLSKQLQAFLGATAGVGDMQLNQTMQLSQTGTRFQLCDQKLSCSPITLRMTLLFSQRQNR